MKPILNLQYDLYCRDDKIFCDSLQIADTFGRQHKHILETIDKLNRPTSGLSEEFRTSNFLSTSYKDVQGRRQRKYLLTKDGFVMVTMEFKTAKARKFKEAYIQRFNAMSKHMVVLHDAKEDFPELTEAVARNRAEPKPYHYINEINMIYSVVLGQSVRSYRKDHELQGSIREHLSTEQLRKVRSLQRIDIGLLITVPDIKQRKEILTEHLSELQKGV